MLVLVYRSNLPLSALNLFLPSFLNQGKQESPRQNWIITSQRLDPSWKKLWYLVHVEELKAAFRWGWFKVRWRTVSLEEDHESWMWRFLSEVVGRRSLNSPPHRTTIALWLYQWLSSEMDPRMLGRWPISGGSSIHFQNSGSSWQNKWSFYGVPMRIGFQAWDRRWSNAHWTTKKA